MDSPYPPPQPTDRNAAVPQATPTCYRHGERPTRLSCSACGRPICVDCAHQGAVGQKCPECARPVGRNRVITAAEVRSRTTGLGGAPVSRGILYVTVAIGILGFVVPQAWAPIYVALVDNVGLVAAGEVHRIVTAALLHSRSPFHLLFNMWALYVFGPELERRFGSLPFALFYLAAAAAGGLGFQVVNSAGCTTVGQPGCSAVGASGAIFGLFGAYLISAYLARNTAAGRAGLNQLLPLLLLNLALPLIIPRIAWEAHIGGLLAGVLMMVLWRAVTPDPAAGRPGGRATVRWSAVAGAVLIACLAVVSLL
ncbi:MAG TPA: rhomboid family intramembrane serine protease [Euzebya sp.]|nr:rhomboid family intramembrane serine protease [Euzebya sp.]